MFTCSFCWKGVQTKSGLMKHELAHKVTFRCRLCDKQYKRKSSLKVHENKNHANDSTKAQFTCCICRKIFASAKNFKLHAKSHSQLGSGQKRSAINDNVVVHTLRPRGIDRFDLTRFLSSVKPSVEKYLLNKVQHQAIKWYFVSQVELTREDREGEIRTVEPYFRSVTYTFLSKEEYEVHDVNEALQKMVIGLEKYIHESSGWILKTVKKLDIHTVSYKPLGGSCFIDFPKTLANSYETVTIDDLCGPF